MRPFLKLVVCFYAVYLSGCAPENGVDSHVSCPSPVSMNDGEIVTYIFTYANGETLNHTLTKAQDGDESGEVIYSVSDGRTSNYKLSDLCANKPVSLTAEAFFLLLDGGSLSILRGVEQTFSDESEKPPLEFIEKSCSDVTLTVPAGVFSTQACVFDAKDSSESFTSYVQANQEAATPLRGLIKHVWSDSSRKVTVELTEWNGL
ncbi:MAG: hypothetical protein COB33_012365 [Thiotrichaceae bacterium]|nr:hypothetical protein [Thiotrichaceae bacterium]